ncbi:MAG: succinate--CoA ligase subunit alpha [Armatimonadota bacterium]|jgi:succinyl-CoA synthetase alpha subunit
MGILIDKSTKVIVQGMSGREGEFHSRAMIEYGTNVVAGVTPGKGGTEVLDRPMYDSVKAAVDATGATASVIFVPMQFAADAVMEAASADLDVVACITEGIPVQDMVGVVDYAQERGTRLVGPNCPGMVTADECKLGIMPGHIFTRGPVGLVSRSGTLTYEVVDLLTRAGIGQSTCVGVGGDPILGTRFIDLLPLFEADDATEVVMLIGEIGGSDEEVAAEYIATMQTPVVGFISGRTAPPGKRMGHAGAIISGGTGTPEAKVEALTAAGVPIADAPHEIPALVQQQLAASSSGA